MYAPDYSATFWQPNCVPTPIGILCVLYFYAKMLKKNLATTFQPRLCYCWQTLARPRVGGDGGPLRRRSLSYKKMTLLPTMAETRGRYFKDENSIKLHLFKGCKTTFKLPALIGF